jgi:glycosyltransferase involved in cell wall biosynthesis
MAKIAVLIPAYNEAVGIAKVIEDYRNAIPSAEIFVYDNNSTDATVELARRAGAQVQREPRQGKGNVLRAMFRDIDADVYLMTDADNTYPASSAQKMVDLVLNQKVDMVIGDRLSTSYFNENKRSFHNFGNRLVRSLINFLFKSNLGDIMTGARAFSYQFVKTFPVLSRGFEIETEMTIHALDKNMLIAQIPVEYRDRAPGDQSKLNTTADGIRVLKMIFLLLKEYKPLFFFGILTALFGVAGLVAVAIPTFEFWATGYVSKVPTLMGGILLLLIALLSFTTGLILDVVARKSRQQFELSLNFIRALGLHRDIEDALGSDGRKQFNELKRT